MVSEALDFRFLLLENYKKLKLNEQELAVILMVDHLISQGLKLPMSNVSSILSLKMCLDETDIDKILANFDTKGYVAWPSQSGETIISLDPLKKILFREFQFSLTKEGNEEDEKEINEQLENIFQVFGDKLGRQLSPVEISRIREWIEHGFSDERIIDALNEALARTKKGKPSLKTIDKILLSWEQRDDIERDGVTTRSEEWDMNLEETIRIAKTPWLDDDDDK